MRFPTLISFGALAVVTSCQETITVGPTTYKSSRAILPQLNITNYGKPLAPGLFALTFKKRGYLITNGGKLVYEGKGGENFHVTTLHDKPVISYFHGLGGGKGFGYGETVIMDDTYKVIKVVCPKLGLQGPHKFIPTCQGDLHESYITNRGTLVVTAYNVTQTDLSALGGPVDGWVIDGQFYEIDIATDEILYSWKSLEHVPVTDSRAPLNGGAGKTRDNPYDYFHINSVQPIVGGRYLVSSRDVSSVYLIAPDQSIIWEFNGHGGGTFGALPNLPNGKPANFAVQHDARLRKITPGAAIIHFFNNNNPTPIFHNVSAGMEFELDTTTNTSSLLRYLHDPHHRYSSFKEGDYQDLPGDHVVLGYGAIAVIQEFGAEGDLLLTIRFGTRGQNDYRSTKAVWHANPHYPPALVVEGSHGFVSWNGATEVTDWVVYAGRTRGNLEKRETLKKRSYETRFRIPANLQASGGFVQVYAYDDQKLLRKSRIVQF